MKTAFIGHRDFLPLDIEQRLQNAIQKQIDSGCRYFIVGTHGEFDRKALSICRCLQTVYPDLKIEVVITSLHQNYQDVETIFFEIETVHYKRRIIESNQQMLRACDTLICYVRPNLWRSGAKRAFDYAVKFGLQIINLFQKNDLF